MTFLKPELILNVDFPEKPPDLSDDNSNDVQREVDGDDQEGQIRDGYAWMVLSMSVDLFVDRDGLVYLSGNKVAAGRREECELGIPCNTCNIIIVIVINITIIIVTVINIYLAYPYPYHKTYLAYPVK